MPSSQTTKEIAGPPQYVPITTRFEVSGLAEVEKMLESYKKLGIRSELEIQNEINKTKEAYKELAEKGFSSAADQARALARTKEAVGGLEKELNTLMNGPSRSEKLLKDFGAIKKGALAVAETMKNAYNMVKEPAKGVMAYEYKAAQNANVLYYGQSPEDKKKGMEETNERIKAATQFGGNREDVSDSITNLVLSGTMGSDVNAAREEALSVQPLMVKNLVGSGATLQEQGSAFTAGKGTFGIKKEDDEKFMDLMVKAAHEKHMDPGDFYKEFIQQLDKLSDKDKASYKNSGLEGARKYLGNSIDPCDPSRLNGYEGEIERNFAVPSQTPEAKFNAAKNVQKDIEYKGLNGLTYAAGYAAEALAKFARANEGLAVAAEATFVILNSLPSGTLTNMGKGLFNGAKGLLNDFFGSKVPLAGEAPALTEGALAEGLPAAEAAATTAETMVAEAAAAVEGIAAEAVPAIESALVEVAPALEGLAGESALGLAAAPEVATVGALALPALAVAAAGLAGAAVGTGYNYLDEKFQLKEKYGVDPLNSLLNPIPGVGDAIAGWMSGGKDTTAKDYLFDRVNSIYEGGKGLVTGEDSTAQNAKRIFQGVTGFFWDEKNPAALAQRNAAAADAFTAPSAGLKVAESVRESAMPILIEQFEKLGKLLSTISERPVLVEVDGHQIMQANSKAYSKEEQRR